MRSASFSGRAIAIWMVWVVAAVGLSVATGHARDRWSNDNDQQGDNSAGAQDGDSFGRERDVAGKFDYYALVLSWSPTFCSNATDRDRMQCDRQDGRRFSFVLHGLWPQYERGYPGECRTARRPFVPKPIIESMLDIMPAPGLITHEYRKHGTCSGLDPQTYFSTARALFNRIRIPERLTNPFETQVIGQSELAREFMRANPALKPEQFAIGCAGGPNGRLKEMRFCFTKEGEPRDCGENENQRRMCQASQIYVPPVRSTARDEPLANARKPQPQQPSRLPPQYQSPSQSPSPPPSPPSANDPRRPLPGFKPIDGTQGI